MKTSRWDPLLNDLLTGAEAASCRASSLELMLESGRRCQRDRRVRRVAAWAVVSGAAALAIFLSRSPAMDTRLAASATSSVPAELVGAPWVEEAAGGKAPVRFISDEELLDLFPGRSVALVGAPGRQQLVFLGQVQEIE